MVTDAAAVKRLGGTKVWEKFMGITGKVSLRTSEYKVRIVSAT